MKKIILLCILHGILAHADAKDRKPHTVYVGLESGVGFSKSKMEAYSDHYFKNPTSMKLASTGFHLGIELFKHGFFELGLNQQTFTYNHVEHKMPDGSGFTSYGGGATAFGTSLRFRYKLKVTKSFSILPMAGINLVSIDAPSQSSSPFSWDAAGQIETPQGTIYDTLFVSTNYYSNQRHSLELGTDFSYAISNRLAVALGVYYTINPEYYSTQWLMYKKTNMATEYVTLSYGGNELAAKLSVRWQLGSIISPERKKRTASFYKEK